ncbi:MAG: preprotein translocase subunit YajC [Gemmatimonadota bacterium]
MNLFTLAFMAPQGGTGSGSGGAMILLFQIVAIGAVFYFLIIRPQGKARKQHEQMLGALKKGDEVVTTGGIIGEVTEIKDDRVTIESGDSTLIVRRDRIVQIGGTPEAGARAG